MRLGRQKQLRLQGCAWGMLWHTSASAQGKMGTMEPPSPPFSQPGKLESHRVMGQCQRGKDPRSLSFLIEKKSFRSHEWEIKFYHVNPLRCQGLFLLEQSLMHPDKYNSPYLFSACYYVKNSMYIWNFLLSSCQPSHSHSIGDEVSNYLRRQLGCIRPWK